MGLAFTTQIDSALMSWDLGKGLKLARVRMTIGATADYSSGFDLDANKGKMGFLKLVTVLEATVRQSNGTLRGTLAARWDVVTKKLRLYTVVAPTSSAPTLTLTKQAGAANTAPLLASDANDVALVNDTIAATRTGITGVQAPTISNGVLVEITAGTHLAAADICDMLVLGIG